MDKEEAKERKQLQRTLRRLNGMLTPMSKYYCSEMSVRVAHNAIQVLGGSGYMKDYPAERYLRDARITTIYEGTSQLQVVAAVRGVSSGTFEAFVEEQEKKQYADPVLAELRETLADGKRRVLEAMQFVKQQGSSYLDLSGRQAGRRGDHRDGRPPALRPRGHQRAQEARRPPLPRSAKCRSCGPTASRFSRPTPAPLGEYDLLAGPVPAAG